MAEDNDALLSLLNSYGQQFMSSFDSSAFAGKRKDTPEAGPSSLRKKRKVEEVPEPETESDEEWGGFGDSEADEEGDEEDVQASSEDEAPEDLKGKKPAVVVFADTSSKSASAPPMGSKAQLKAFMSSKVAKLTQEPIQGEQKDESDEDGDDDLTNAQNDKLLHQLVHTKILSGSLDPDLNLTPAQRRKALAGRVLEAAGKAKLGKGENAVRSKERNKAAKHVRDGMVAKQKERREKTLEEAKHMGNYHPALKQLFDIDEEKKPQKKRERGLGMGVGKFSGGILKLSKDDIAKATEGWW
ncbi:hypothetical protein PsYK624_007680 [Phanerochaete sordida]|uniref:Rrp15p-domain-containing protein n=1 Tax=Phanerochaete sordida TaxID=48140 RepID=A0A9P3FY87_9APHY|nr:hypothetical protein PsYK624_007680 [Phanerochaete sordida]